MITWKAHCCRFGIDKSCSYEFESIPALLSVTRGISVKHHITAQRLKLKKTFQVVDLPILLMGSMTFSKGADVVTAAGL